MNHLLYIQSVLGTVTMILCVIITIPILTSLYNSKLPNEVTMSKQHCLRNDLTMSKFKIRFIYLTIKPL